MRQTQERPDDQTPRSKLCLALRALDARIDKATATLSPRQRSALLLALSLLFAGATIAAAWFLRAERSQTLVWMLVAIWWIPFSVLSSGSTDSGRGRCGRRG